MTWKAGVKKKSGLSSHVIPSVTKKNRLQKACQPHVKAGLIIHVIPVLGRAVAGNRRFDVVNLWIIGPSK